MYMYMYTYIFDGIISRCTYAVHVCLTTSRSLHVIYMSLYIYLYICLYIRLCLPWQDDRSRARSPPAGATREQHRHTDRQTHRQTGVWREDADLPFAYAPYHLRCASVSRPLLPCRRPVFTWCRVSFDNDAHVSTAGQ